MFSMAFSHTIDFGNGVLEVLELGLIAVGMLWIRLLHKRVRHLENRLYYMDQQPNGLLQQRGNVTDGEITRWLEAHAPQHRKPASRGGDYDVHNRDDR